jgi:putative ABC transport system permease protein
VCGDVRQFALASPPEPAFYMSAYQNPRELALVIRTMGEPGPLIAAVRKVVREADPNAPVHEVATLRQLMSDSVASWRTNLLMIGSFAALALVLAAIGIYGVVSYSVAQRTHEIGIRIALGASTRMVLCGMGRDIGVLVLAGMGAGTAGALALTRVLASMLFGVTATDVPTFAAVVILLGVVALAASYVPLRRAMRVDPIIALKCQ